MNDDTTELWWHLIEAHGLNGNALHGNPGLMHAAAHAFGVDHGHTHEWSDGGTR